MWIYVEIPSQLPKILLSAYYGKSTALITLLYNMSLNFLLFFDSPVYRVGLGTFFDSQHIFITGPCMDSCI